MSTTETPLGHPGGDLIGIIHAQASVSVGFDYGGGRRGVLPYGAQSHSGANTVL